jgi:predicted nucleic acid-binding Zn ribbon protein
MFCDRCGTEVQADHRFCSSCGREFSGAALAYPRRSRVHEHVRLLGILWLALSALNAVGGVVLYVLSHTLFTHLPEMPPEVTAWLPTFLSFIGVLVVIKAAAGFLAGWGLLQREPWARLLTIVLAFLALFNIPFGTALGIYSLWVLLPHESEAEYQEQARTATA